MIDAAYLELSRQLADALAKRASLGNGVPTYAAIVDRQIEALRRELAGAPGTEAAGSRVTIKDLAERLDMDRSACRRYVLRLGHKPVKQRTAESGFQFALTLSEAEAASIVQFRASEGYVPRVVHVVQAGAQQ